MDREIKFRGKKLLENEWVEGYLTASHEIRVFITDEWEGQHEGFMVDPGTVGQFTGVKNLYEGDVFNMGDPNIKYVVVWHDSGFMGKQTGSSSYAGLEHWKDRIEIIGNIHDNPELLK